MIWHEAKWSNRLSLPLSRHIHLYSKFFVLLWTSLLQESVFKTRCTSQITTTSCATCIGCAPKNRHRGTREVLLPDRTNSTRTLPGFVLSFDVVVDGENERTTGGSHSALYSLYFLMFKQHGTVTYVYAWSTVASYLVSRERINQ